MHHKALVSILILCCSFYVSNAQTAPGDQQVLVDLYNSTNGDSWTNNAGWLTGDASTWYGITVVGGRVTGINLGENNLTGTLPASIDQLTGLVNLDILLNSVSGVLPDTFWDITTLQTIQLCCGNNITGTLPASIGLLDLVVLDLGGNSFTGALPPELFNNINLQFINLWDDEDDGMNLTGTIPSTIANLTSLVVFNMPDNRISGTIPAEITSLAALEVLSLAANQLTGSIPSDLGNLTQLQELDLTGNLLTGNFPSSVSNLNNIKIFRLGGNTITGVLPDLSNLVQLEELSLWGNQMTGGIPASIGNLVNLQKLYLTNNLFSGPLPAEIGNLLQLEGLAFNNNQITGPFPSSISNLKKATYFEFDNNPINDIIPSAIGSMTSLQSVSLNNAQLQGNIPDELWQLPSLLYIATNQNPALSANLPANLGTLTQLKGISFWGIQPSYIAFPESVYNLTQLEFLDFGGQKMTGGIDSRIQNFTNLRSLYLWSNSLTGDFPQEINQLTNLIHFSMGDNFFTSCPALSNLVNLEMVDVSNNHLSFKDIVPNISLGIPDFIYAPQRNTVEGENFTADKGGSITLNTPYSEASNEYQWFKNTLETGNSSSNFSINNISLSDLGGYYAVVTNPLAPELTLRTNYYNLAFTGAPRSFTVDNGPGSVADFNTLYAAIYGTNDGDTLYIRGSDTGYATANSYGLLEKRVLIGPGYFLNQNPETQANNTLTANIPALNIRPGANGSTISGLSIDYLYLNSQPSSVDDTLKNVIVSNNKMRGLVIADDNRFHSISGNFIDNLEFWSTPAEGTSRSYRDITINNNIIDTVTTSLAKATAIRNDMENIVFDRNTINYFTDSVENAVLTNNIINSYMADNNTASGTQDFTAAGFTNMAISGTVDNSWVPATAVDAGAFSGSKPYTLSGIPNIPHIHELADQGRIRISSKVDNSSGSTIVAMEYILSVEGEIMDKGRVKGLTAENEVEVIFRPRLGNIVPESTVDMYVWAIDNLGVKSIPQSISFVATTTSVSGNITTSLGSSATAGEVFLFEINQEGVAFDTLSSVINTTGEFFFPTVVLGDYLAVAKPDEATYPDELPTYYERIDLWEEADTLLIEDTDPQFNIQLIERPDLAAGNGIVEGYIEEDLNNTSGRVLARGRVKRAGVSMRRRSRTGRTNEDEYVLYAFVYSDENGAFNFDDLPADEYIINIQYPGYPMNTNSDIYITIEETKNDQYKLAALVDNSEISVTILSTTAVSPDFINQVSVFPNPANSQSINVKLTEPVNLNRLTIQIIDMQGQEVLWKNVEDSVDSIHELNISHLQQGAYILKVNHNGKAVSQHKLMIN